MMIIPARWLIKDRLIYAYAEGTSTMEELREHSHRLITLLDAGTPPVHLLLESTPDYRPEKVDLRSGIDSLRFVFHPSLGWAVQVLEGNHGMRFIARLISRFARVSYQSVDTREQAFSFLQVVDDTLDWTQVNQSVLFVASHSDSQNSVPKP